MKYLILVIISTYFISLFGLECDSYYQYQVGGFQTQSLDHIISGCDACGYIYSNVTDFSYFRGFFAGCLSTTKVLAQKYDNTIFNMTEFKEICDKNNKLGVPYCQGVTSINNNNQQVYSNICCCSRDKCTRAYFQ